MLGAFLVRIFPHSASLRTDTPSSYSVQMPENTEEKNFEYGHFLPSDTHYLKPSSYLLVRSIFPLPISM